MYSCGFVHAAAVAEPVETVATVAIVAATPEPSPVSTIDPDAPCPRSCTVKRWPDFTGYGFNLHAEKGRAGHFIGDVDKGSPADLAGLQREDKIIAVNGSSIREDNHQATVNKIKDDPNKVTLLVVNSEAEEYYRSRDITISDDLPNVQRIECPDADPGMISYFVFLQHSRCHDKKN